MLLDLVCAGPHPPGKAPTLGSIELPDDSPAPDQGALCVDCGDVYRVGVSAGRQAAGVVVDADLVAELLPDLRPAGWTPKHQLEAPSWTAETASWPYPADPANPTALGLVDP